MGIFKKVKDAAKEIVEALDDVMPPLPDPEPKPKPGESGKDSAR